MSTRGTDAHDTRRRPPVLSGLARTLRRLGGDATMRELTGTNPAKIIGEQQVTLTPRAPDAGPWCL